MPTVDSLNIGTARPIAAKSGVSGIDKRPVDHPVLVREPERDPNAGSGMAGDQICDTENHGGKDQAVYAYAREDLNRWETELEQPLPSGVFGENLTTAGLDITNARIGERWRIGGQAVLQVTVPRIPCRTFATWLRRRGWVKTFTSRAVPGTYLSVIRAGYIRSGAPVVIEDKPDHDVSVGEVFRALTTQPELLPQLVDIEELPEDVRESARRRAPFDLG